MPPQTGLQFFRKKQTINHLAIERPQNLRSFYEAVEASLKGIEQKLKRLEFGFYGTETVEEEIKKWLPALDITMKFAKTGTLICKPQLQDLFDLYERSMGDPTMVVSFDKESIQLVLELINKVITYLKRGFKEVTDSLLNILGYMRKYCLSFVGTEGDIYLETATNYEKQRQELAEAIKINLDDIHIMANRFEREGVNMQEFGSVPKKIAEKCDCGHVPLLVMFPAACENVRNACIGVRKWIQADQGYPSFILFDAQDIEKKKEIQSRSLRDAQTKCSHLDHRIKVCQRDINDCINDLKKVSSKEKSVKRQLDTVSKELHEYEVDIEVKTMRLDELKAALSVNGNKEKFEKLKNEIDLLKTKTPPLIRKTDELKRKLDVLTVRRDVKEKREEEVIEIKQDLKVARKELRKIEIEMERLDINLAKLREVHRFKTSQEVLKKLFYNMPLSNKGSLGAKNKKGGGTIDKLDKATRFVAADIDGDWCRLYRSLPFHPPRGEENIRIDIDEIMNQFMRDTQETQAKQCLSKWRRLHTRASVVDLIKALTEIRRRDIADKLNEEILRKSPAGGVLVEQMMNFQRMTPQSSTKLVRFPKMPVSNSNSRQSGVFIR